MCNVLLQHCRRAQLHHCSQICVVLAGQLPQFMPANLPSCVHTPPSPSAQLLVSLKRDSLIDSLINYVLSHITLHALHTHVQASCTRAVESSIVSQLQLSAPLLIRGGFNRPNISYSVRTGECCAVRLAVCVLPMLTTATHCRECRRQRARPPSLQSCPCSACFVQQAVCTQVETQQLELGWGGTWACWAW
jgi:hypothetical protein